MVKQLIDEYAAANKPVVFFEQSVYSSVGPSRKTVWWNAFGGGSATFPFVMADSGYWVKSGVTNFKTESKAAIDAALLRPPKAAISAMVNRVNNTLHFTGEVTSLSGVDLDTTVLYAIVYEDVNAPVSGKGLTGKYVRVVTETYLQDPSDSGTATFDLQTEELTNVGDWNKLHPVVVVDYYPNSSSNKHDSLQVAVETGIPPSWQVTPAKTGNGIISPSTVQMVTHNTTASFTLQPGAGLHAGSVTGSCPAGILSGNSYTTGAIVENCTVIINFTDRYPLRLDFSGSGSGTVTYSTTAGNVNHTVDNITEYFRDTVVTLTAVADEKNTFIGWSGGGCSGIGICKVTMDQNRNIAAVFKNEAPWILFMPPILGGK